MSGKKRRTVSKPGTNTPAQKKKEEIYYPMSAMMNGAASVFFALITIVFPLLIGTEKYAAITKFKKTTFIVIAILMLSVSLVAFILSATTTPKHRSKKNAEGVGAFDAAGGFSAELIENLTITQGIVGGFAAIALICLIVTSQKVAFGISLALLLAAFAAVSLIKYSGRESTPPSIERKKSFLGTITLADVAVIAYWVLMNISAFCSDAPLDSIVGLEKRNNGVFIQTLYILMYFVISRGIQLKAVKIRFYTWAGMAVSVIAVFHYFGIDLLSTGFGEARWRVEMIADKTTRVNKGMNFLGSIGNINLLSYVIVICLVVTVMLYVIKGSPKWDKYGIVMLFCCFVMSFAERCSRTDAGIVALIGAAGFGVMVMCTGMERLRRICISFGVTVLGWWLHYFVVDVTLKHGNFGTTCKALLCGGIMLCALGAALTLLRDVTARIKDKYVHIGAIAVVCLGAVGACVLAVHVAKTQSEGTFYEFGQMLMGHFEDKYGNGRVKIWRNTIKLIDERPLVGIGPDRFSPVFTQKIGTLFPGKNLDKAHNEYLDVLICNGILGLGTFMTFLGGLLAKAVKKSKTMPVAGVFAVAMAAYMVHSFFGYQLPIQSPVMFAMLGMTGAACIGQCEDLPDERI